MTMYGENATTDARKVHGSKSEEKTDEARTEHPVCIGLKQQEDIVLQGPRATGRNGPSGNSVAGVGHGRRNFREGYPQEYSIEGNDRPKVYDQEEGKNKDEMGSTLVPLRYALSV
jgi:hypothetical protein